MTQARPLKPTLWRTCRALANRTRLQLFKLLLTQPDQTVSAAAGRLEQPLPAISQYLRVLEARGLLAARRAGREVKYRINPSSPGGPTQGLVAALQLVFQRDPEPVETVFTLATAFTHPRRIVIFRALRNEPRTPRQIRSATGISMRALLRHLQKLEVRGFVKCQQGRYGVTTRRDALGRELARLAAQND